MSTLSKVKTYTIGNIYTEDDINDILTIKQIYMTYLSYNRPTNIYQYVENISNIKKCYPQVSFLIYMLVIASTVYFRHNDLKPETETFFTEKQKKDILDIKIIIIDKLLTSFKKYYDVGYNLLEKLKGLTKKRRVIKYHIDEICSNLLVKLTKFNESCNKIIGLLNACIDKNSFDISADKYILQDKYMIEIVTSGKRRLCEKYNVRDVSEINDVKDDVTFVPDNELIDRVLKRYLNIDENIIQQMNVELSHFPTLQYRSNIRGLENLKDDYELLTTGSNQFSDAGERTFVASAFGGYNKFKVKNTQKYKNIKKTRKYRQRTNKKYNKKRNQSRTSLK